MGVSRILVDYVVIMRIPGSHMTPCEWRTAKRGKVPGHGRPTDANLAEYVRRFEESTRPGGCNEHLGVQAVKTARIVHQATQAVVASYGDTAASNLSLLRRLWRVEFLTRKNIAMKKKIAMQSSHADRTQKTPSSPVKKRAIRQAVHVSLDPEIRAIAEKRAAAGGYSLSRYLEQIIRRDVLESAE